MVSDIHKRGGTILKSSRGGSDTKKIVDAIEDREFDQVCQSQFFVFTKGSFILICQPQICVGPKW